MRPHWSTPDVMGGRWPAVVVRLGVLACPGHVVTRRGTATLPILDWRDTTVMPVATNTHASRATGKAVEFSPHIGLELTSTERPPPTRLPPPIRAKKSPDWPQQTPDGCFPGPHTRPH